MADKNLRITFSGISTLWPGPQRKGGKPPDQAFVIMPANVKKKSPKEDNEWDTTIPEHFPFVHVAASLLINPPPADETVVVAKGSKHLIYFFLGARVVIDKPTPGTRIEYFIDKKKRPLAERPGSIDVAPPDDIRWLADARDILSEPVPLKFNPAESASNEAAAIVNLDGGMLRANFPGDTVNAKTFVDAQGHVVPGLRRVLADEFIIDIPYPEETEQVTLTFSDLRTDTPVTPLKMLVLKWPDKETTLELRMGNDPKEEVRRLDTDDRFDPLRKIGPALKPRENDFDLHYNLLAIPPKVGRPLPQNDIQQCDFQGCKPKTG